MLRSGTPCDPRSHVTGETMIIARKRNQTLQRNGGKNLWPTATRSSPPRLSAKPRYLARQGTASRARGLLSTSKTRRAARSSSACTPPATRQQSSRPSAASPPPPACPSPTPCGTAFNGSTEAPESVSYYMANASEGFIIETDSTAPVFGLIEAQGTISSATKSHALERRSFPQKSSQRASTTNRRSR